MRKILIALHCRGCYLVQYAAAKCEALRLLAHGRWPRRATSEAERQVEHPIRN